MQDHDHDLTTNGQILSGFISRVSDVEEMFKEFKEEHLGRHHRSREWTRVNPMKPAKQNHMKEPEAERTAGAEAATINSENRLAWWEKEQTTVYECARRHID